MSARGSWPACWKARRWRCYVGSSISPQAGYKIFARYKDCGLASQRYCYPLTITDFASRYLLCCEALETTKECCAFSVFERAF